MNAKNKGKIFVIILAYAVAFVGVALLVAHIRNVADSEISFEDYSADASRFNNENYFDLKTNNLFKVDEEVSSDRIFVLEEAFFTNSHAISVTNNSDSCIDVYLFRKDGLDQAIQQFSLDGKSCKSFSNLTSRFLYQIGIGVEADSQICLTISK